MVASTAMCAAEIQEWTGRTLHEEWEIVNNVNIVILASGTFKFQSVTGGSLDAIAGSITIDDSVTGTVTLHIARNPADNAGTNGATNVGSINLTNSHATPVVGNLAELRIDGDLGTLGPTVVRNVTGVVTLANNHDVVDDITINNDITANGHITADQLGDVTVTRWLLGSIECNSMGDLIQLEAAGNTVGGDVTIHGGYAGAMDFQTHYSGNIVIEGNLTGTIAIGTVGTRLRNMTGTITIGTVLAPANLSVPGRIAIAGDASNLDDPPIWIQGSITGTGASAPMIYVGDQVFGTIAVNGSLANTDSSGPEIEIANGTWGTAGAVAINYDGASAAADDWASGAGVKLGSTTYTSNNPANRIWNVSHCKGDFNGDRAVNSSDGTPFNDYKNNNATYLSNYPGLKGSAIYHADGDFDNAWTAPPSTDNYRIMSLIDTGCDCVAEEPASNCPGDPTDINPATQCCTY